MVDLQIIQSKIYEIRGQPGGYSLKIKFITIADVGMKTLITSIWPKAKQKIIKTDSK